MSAILFYKILKKPAKMCNIQVESVAPLQVFIVLRKIAFYNAINASRGGALARKEDVADSLFQMCGGKIR